MRDENVEQVKIDEEEEVELIQLVFQMANPTPDKSGCIEVSAKKDAKEAIIFYDFGDDLVEMTEKFGDDVVFTNARSKMKIALQAAMRTYLKAGQSIEKLMSTYVPGVSLERMPVDMNKATENYFSGLSETEQDAMIARLMQHKNI